MLLLDGPLLSTGWGLCDHHAAYLLEGNRFGPVWEHILFWCRLMVYMQLLMMTGDCPQWVRHALMVKRPVSTLCAQSNICNVYTAKLEHILFFSQVLYWTFTAPVAYNFMQASSLHCIAYVDCVGVETGLNSSRWVQETQC